MNTSFRNLLLLVAFLACGSIVKAQLPNEKFGKPSSMEWDFYGWGDATDADAVILCKTMKVTYQLSDQVSNNNLTDGAISTDNIHAGGPGGVSERIPGRLLSGNQSEKVTGGMLHEDRYF